MDIPADNDSYPMSSPGQETESVSPQVQEEPDASEPSGVGKKPALSSPVGCEVAGRLACVSEVREAKIHELQESVQNGTYHIAAEEIADKMLRSILIPDLT